jgi:hypothetical protein
MAGIAQHSVDKASSEVGQPKHFAGDIREALADAIHGAGDKPDIDSLLNAVSNAAHGHQAVNALAAVGPVAHDPFGSVLMESHMLMNIHETMMVHQLVAPPA